MIRLTNWIKNKALLPTEGKAADLGKALIVTLFCGIALLLCMKPFLYIAIQIIRFMIFSFLWICDIIKCRYEQENSYTGSEGVLS